MKFLMTFVVPERSVDTSSDEEMREAMAAWNEFDRQATEAGVLIACEPLEAPNEVRTLSVSDGSVSVTDGPFAESKEQVGGFALFDCSGMDEALEWARKVPLDEGHIEVRPVMDLSRFGFESPTQEPQEAAR
jgi:hypothetical protein